MDPGTRPDGEELAAMQEQLADARADVERLQQEAANAVAEAAAMRLTARTSRDMATNAIAEAGALREGAVASREAAEAADRDAATLREELDAATQRSQRAAERYRDLVVRTDPTLPADLVAGDDVDAIDASAAAAREVRDRVLSRLGEQFDIPRVPAGAPARLAPDLSALTPEQKIRYGLAQQS